MSLFFPCIFLLIFVHCTFSACGNPTPSCVSNLQSRFFWCLCVTIPHHTLLHAQSAVEILLVFACDNPMPHPPACPTCSQDSFGVCVCLSHTTPSCVPNPQLRFCWCLHVTIPCHTPACPTCSQDSFHVNPVLHPLVCQTHK